MFHERVIIVPELLLEWLPVLINSSNPCASQKPHQCDLLIVKDGHGNLWHPIKQVALPSRNVMKSIEATLSMQCTWWKAIDLHWLCSTYNNDNGTSSTHQDLRPSTKVRNLYSLHKWCPQIALIVFVLMHGNGIVRISIGLMPVVSWGAPPLLLADVLLSECYVPSITLHTGLWHDFLFNFNVHFE